MDLAQTFAMNEARGQTNYASLRNGNFVCLSIRVWSEMELFSKLFDLNQAETWVSFAKENWSFQLSAGRVNERILHILV